MVLRLERLLRVRMRRVWRKVLPVVVPYLQSVLLCACCYYLIRLLLLVRASVPYQRNGSLLRVRRQSSRLRLLVVIPN